MTTPAQHAQLVIPIFELSITKRTLMCLTENLLIMSTGARYVNYCKRGKCH